MNRTTFLVDGFNLYHSLKRASQELASAGGYDPRTVQRGTKWLDLRGLCESHLYLVGKDATLERIYYFSALAKHMEPRRPGTLARHRAYLSCLKNGGVEVELSRFKRKERFCPKCFTRNIQYEEKETDVALAAKLLELLHRDECETVVLMTGDTDIAPAIRTAQRLFSGCGLVLMFPFRRKNDELAKLGRSFTLSRDAYVKNQLPDPVTLTDGTIVAKPPAW